MLRFTHRIEPIPVVLRRRRELAKSNTFSAAVIIDEFNAAHSKVVIKRREGRPLAQFSDVVFD